VSVWVRVGPQPDQTLQILRACLKLHGGASSCACELAYGLYATPLWIRHDVVVGVQQILKIKHMDTKLCITYIY